MRATQEQYEKAVELYETEGLRAVYTFAESIGIDEFGECAECDDEVPLCEDGCCLVCGSITPEKNF